MCNSCAISFPVRLTTPSDGHLAAFKVPEGLVMVRNGMLKTSLKSWMLQVNGIWMKQA